MRISTEHIRFISEKIAHELINSKMVAFTRGEDPVIDAAGKRIEEEVKLEKAVDAEVNRIMSEHDDDISFYQADPKQAFWLIKRRIADQYGLILEKEERFNNLAHKVLDDLYEEDLISYTVSENLVKNAICKAILDFGRRHEELEDKVHDKLRNYKRKVQRGSVEYDILYEKFYEEELAKTRL
ncbi:hypothetical protein FACS189487_05830 [Campylobacterota bacterium]|nr:hypothetical protein FACS189487_05830 [Campylobacterota bacterium]